VLSRLTTDFVDARRRRHYKGISIDVWRDSLLQRRLPYKLIPADIETAASIKKRGPMVELDVRSSDHSLDRVDDRWYRIHTSLITSSHVGFLFRTIAKLAERARFSAGRLCLRRCAS